MKAAVSARFGSGWRRNLLRAGVSVACLAVLLWRVDLPRVWQALQALDYVYFVPTTLLAPLSITLRAVRWRYILWSEKAIPARRLLGVYAVGLLLAAVLPGVGEASRALLLRDQEGVSGSFVFGTTILEKALDIGALLLALGLVLLALTSPLWLAAGAVLTLLVLAAAPFMLGWAARRLPRAAEGIRPGLGARVKRLARAFLEGLLVLRHASRRNLALIGFHTLVLFVITWGMYYFALRALGWELPLHAPLLLAAVINIGLAVPSLPGGVGVFQALTVAALGALDVSAEAALSFSLALHLATFLPALTLGGGFWWRVQARARRVTA